MPFLLPAAATAVAAAAPAAAATTAAATAGATLTSIATNIAMNVAISAVMSALQPQVGAAGRTAEWTLSPDGPIPFAAGRIGVAGSVVHRATFGPDLMYLGVPAVLSGAGPIDGYESFKADDEWVNFDGNGKAISSQYAGELWYRRTMGYQPDVAVTSPPGLKSNATLPGWGAQHKLSGKAAYMVVMGENSKGTAFPTGEIKPLITLRGLKGWDPRLDSTWPGGDGPCRLDSPATWVYLRRPGLWGLKWALGLWEGPTLKGAPAHGSATDHQVGGIGAKLSGIDVAAFVNLENICDANDWTVSAYPTTDDDKFAVLESFLQAGGATFAMRAGKISCIQRAAPRTSIVTISAADTAGPLEIDTAASRIDRINTIRPRIMSEAHRWQMTAIAEVSAQAYRDQDGGIRPRGIDYTYVDKATQGAQLAALQIANTREGIAGVIPLKPHLQKIKPGDAFTIAEPGFVLNGLKCLCLSTEFDPSTKIVAVSFVSETDAKYPFALGQSQEPPTPAELEPVDPRYVSPPGETEWEIVARPPAEGGAQVPGFDLVGEVDNATATALLVEWGPTAEGPWTQAYMGPPTAERIPITGVQPNAVYYVSTMNIRGQNYSQRRVYGPYTAPPLVSNDTVNVGDMPAGDVANAASQVPGLALTLAGAQLTLADHQAQLYTATTGLLDRTASMFAALNTPTTGVVARLGAVEQSQQSDNLAAVLRLQAIEATIGDVGLNRVKNPTARRGLQNWHPTSGAWSTYDPLTDDPYFYSYVAAGADQNSYMQTAPADRIAVVAGHSYTLQLESFVTANAQAGAMLGEIYWFNASGVQLPTSAPANRPAAVSAGAWVFSKGTATAPAGAVAAAVVCGAYGLVLPSQGEVSFRKVKFEPGSVATLWTDDAEATVVGARIAAQEQVTFDLAANKANASDLAIMQAEVAVARNGSASLGVQLANMRTATADGLAGKAEAAALAVVAAQLNAGRNLVRNPTAARGLQNWYVVSGNWQAAGPAEDGKPYFYCDFPTAGPGRTGYMHAAATDRYPVSGNGTYSVQMERYAGGFDGGFLLGEVYWYDAGGNYIATSGGMNVGAATRDGAGWVRDTITLVAPPNAVTATVVVGVYAASTYAYARVAARKIKFEGGATATIWTDDAETQVLGAAVTDARSALATLEGRLEGRLILNVTAGNQVSGGQLLAVDGPDGAYSTIDWWSTSFRVSNGGTNPVAPFEVRGDVVRMRSALIDRLSVTTAITVGTFAFPVALEARLAPAADGEVISYGGPLGQVPTLFFRTEGLDPLQPGESYLQYAEGHTQTGFIARRKIQTPATPSAYNLTAVSANAGGGPTTKIERGANPKSADDTYTITGQGYVTFYEVWGGVPVIDEGQTDTIVLSVWERVSGVWTQIGWLYVYAQGERAPNFNESGINQNRGGQTAEQFTCSPSVEAWGVKLEYGDSGQIVSVAYTAQGTGSGVRSATSGGQRPIIEVRIKNA